MANATDAKVQQLFDIVQTKKKEIENAQKSNWVTNCSFGYDRNSSNRINVQVTNDVEELVSALSFLKERGARYAESAKELGVDSVEFKWLGYGIEEWAQDFKTRITKLQIKKKQQELEVLEKRLNALISPDLRAQMELEAISKELGI